MSDSKDDSGHALDIGTVLRGNYSVGAAKIPGIRSDARANASDLTVEMERRARASIGGSIAFVTRLGKNNQDPLLWDGDE